MTTLLSIDIGSTYTKGARFQLAEGRLAVAAYAKTPTTVAHLKDGFDTVRRQLDPEGTADRIVFSSSARGGLAISAIGLVPDLTLKVAKLAALSAGGKVVSVHAYKLTSAHLDELAATRPDILLLAGGTDGGNESYVRHNAAMLAKLPSRLEGLELPAVVYAGNAVLQEEVAEVLRPTGFEVHLASNLLPEVEQVEPESARERIREVFLRTIVHGKGLDEIVAEIGSEPLPTPLAVLTLVEAIRKEAPDFGDFLLVDMGGATTDVYSAGEGLDHEARVILRGIREPEIKRTVEGDLGMRVSASVAAHSARATVRKALGEGEEAAFDAFISHLMAAPDHLPVDAQEDRFDRILASACIQHALSRHAGTWRRVFTASGETFVQTGKDLRQVKKLIGSGGFLSALPDFTPVPEAPDPRSELLSLVPTDYHYFRDNGYLLPLLGSVAAVEPAAAVRCALAILEPMGEAGVEMSLTASPRMNADEHGCSC